MKNRTIEIDIDNDFYLEDYYDDFKECLELEDAIDIAKQFDLLYSTNQNFNNYLTLTKSQRKDFISDLFGVSHLRNKEDLIKLLSDSLD